MFCFLLAFFFTSATHAQYRSTQWTADSGLPQNSVRGIAQTPDGYIWVATLNGVARFDGVRFTVYDKSNTPGISNSRFVAMVRGADDRLWLTSEDGNVVRYHNGQFRTMAEKYGLEAHSVTAITGDLTGNVWVLSNDKVYHWDQDKEHFERESFSTDDLRFFALRWVGTGFWALRGDKILCFSRGLPHTIPLPSGMRPASINNVAYGGDGALWVGTADGKMARWHDGKYEDVPDPFIDRMLNPNDGAWHVRTSHHFQRVLTYPSGGTEHGIAYNIILHDNEGNLWVGSEGDGLFRIQKQSIRSITSFEGLAGDNVYPIFASHDGDIWVGSWPAGLTRLHNGLIVQTFTAADGLPGPVTSISEDNKGTLWVGTHGGLRILSNGKLAIPPYLPAEKLPPVQAIHQARDGAMLLGTPNGLYSLDASHSRWLTAQTKLATDDIRVILEDHRGDTWYGGYGGLTRIHNGAATLWIESQGLPSNNVRAIMEDSAGEIWVGTYDGGIGWLRNGKWVVFNRSHGLFDNGAFQILEDRHGYFWISSNRGIYRLSRKQLVAVADGREARIDSIAYGRADGMASVECNGGLWPAGAKDARGFLWFPTQKGVAVIDPSSVLSIPEPPRVAIEAAIVDHKPQDKLDHITLLPGQSNLEVQYTALSFTKPEQTSFRYKLEGVDDTWQEVGPRHAAYYSHLPAGDHLFRVSARNSDGVASTDDSTLLVTVVPPFYRRAWFLTLSAVVFLAILWAAWHFRVASLKKSQAAQQAFSRELIASQENERRRIAGELHDSLGQRLIIINNLALFLLRTKGKVRTEEDKQQTMEEISAEASSAIEETRAISYALRPFQLDRLGLTRAIQALAKTVARAAEIEILTNLDDIDNAFPEDLRINVYRIVQEALNNVVKHSGATSATVMARVKEHSVQLTISDNGRGLPSTPRPATHGPGGFGLTGMRERATALGGAMHLRTEPGAGTLLTVEFPTRSLQS